MSKLVWNCSNMSELVEACLILFKLVWNGSNLSQTCQIWSKTVKIGLNLSKFFYCSWKCLNPFYFKNSLTNWLISFTASCPNLSELLKHVWCCSNLSDLVQTCQNWSKTVKIGLNLSKKINAITYFTLNSLTNWLISFAALQMQKSGKLSWLHWKTTMPD